MKKFLFWSAGTLFILLILIHLALPSIANFFLHRNGYPAVRITKLALNPISLKLTAGLKASGQTNQKLRIGTAKVDLAWKPFFKKHIHVEGVSLRDIVIDVQQHKDESMNVGAISVSTGTMTPSTTTSEGFYHVTLKSLDLRNGDQPFLTFSQDENKTIDVGIDGTAAVRDLDVGLLPPTTSTSTKSRITDPDLKSKLMHLNFSGDINLTDISYRAFSSSPTPEPEIKIQEVAIDKETEIRFRDESLSPPFEMLMTTVTLRLSQIDSTKVSQFASLVFSAHLGQFDRILVNGSGTPFAKTKSGDIKAKVESLNLSPFSPLTERYIGYQLESGVLDLDSDINLKNDFLKGMNILHIHKLELDRLKKDEKDEFTEQIGLPVNTLLKVLRDKNKDIRLKIPIEGDLSNPDVGIGSVMRKALRKGTMMALTKTVETAFPVLKTAKLAGAIAKFALKLRFDDLIFKPGTADITPASQTYLNEVGEKLVKKEKVRINICGRIAPADLAQMPSANEEEKLDLGKKRSNIVKNYLIEKFQIDQKRLFLCTPEIDDSEKSQPRVEISL